MRMTRASRPGSVAALCATAVLLTIWGCTDDGQGPALGDLVVSTATTGLDIDPAGYVVIVEDLGSQPIGPSGTVTFRDVPARPYLVELSGVPANCTPAGENPRSVTAGSRDILEGRFEISCVPNLGTLQITTSSDGSGIPDAYTVVVADSITREVGANDVVAIEAVVAGEVTVELTLPPNCQIQGEAANPRTVTVPFGDVGPTTFEVECSPTEGSLAVITATEGGDLDPDGYSVVVNDTISEPVDVNGSVTIGALPGGEHTVELTDVAANCTVSGQNPRTVQVPFGDTVSTTFELTCEPYGDLEVSVSSEGMNLPNQVTASVNGGPGQAVGPNDATVFQDLPTGDHTVELSGLPENCEVAGGENPRTVTVASGVGATTFELQCWAWLVFDSDRAGAFDVFIMRHDGAEQTNLTNHPADDRQPVVSPDGTRIAFASRRSGTEHIHRMNRDGTNVVQLTTSNRAKEPQWSPDGTRIVFTAREGSQWDIWIMDADGSNVENLTNSPSGDFRASWSPDGTRIAFDSDRDGVQDIYLMNPDGSGVTRLETGGGGNPAWSPDGTRIAYTATANDELDVWIMDVDGSNQVNLTKLPATVDGESAWSPDGSTIAFATERHGQFEIYLMNPDGTNLRRLTTSPSDDMWPSWVPWVP